jgi:DNA-binding transcriptional regulator YiaG
MNGEEVKTIRENLKLSREEMSEFLCLSGYQSMTNIETNFRKPSKFASKVLHYLDSIPKNKACALIEEINRHET